MNKITKPTMIFMLIGLMGINIQGHASEAERGAISTEFIKGLATIDEKMIIYLDIDLLFSPEHLYIQVVYT